MILTDDQKLIVGLLPARIEVQSSSLDNNPEKIRNFELKDILRIIVYFEIRANAGYKKGQSHINDHLSLSVEINNS